MPCLYGILGFFKEKAGLSATEADALEPVIIVNIKLFNGGDVPAERADEFVLFHIRP